MNITLDRNEEQLTGLLNVHLEEADYSDAVEKQIKETSKKAQFKGFRPGKVPSGLVRKMYGKGILADEINRLLGSSVDSYLKDNNVKILGEPLPVASDVDFDTAKAFDFQFELGLLPDFELPAENQVELKRPTITLDEATLTETNEQIARQFGETTNPEVSEADDYLFGKLKKAGAEGEGQTVLLPINKVKNGQERFIGVKADDTLTFDLSDAFGGDAGAIRSFSGLSKEEAAGATGDYELAIEKINRTAAPEENQELFDKVFGPEAVDSKEAYDAKVRETIQSNYDRESDNLVNRRLVDAMIDATTIQLPVEFFKKWLVRANEGKLDAAMVEQHYTDYERELKWSLIRNKVVEDMGLKVETDEIRNRVLDKILGQFGGGMQLTDEMRQGMVGFADNYMKQDNGKNYVQEYEAILAEKVVEALRGKVVVTEEPVTAEEFRNQNEG
ncbi:trigger factor [Hymenobacter sp. H14-R3]|uniref:trigger factor n=1 Tax=Hymenobacter sp. H14-R3 TaxID=3046308 RepID=UPI0024B9010A|nr:trigger factor [Hymenobacter sp. H14-R3]MDJ0367743.1 trigger factor [Hymenobacter sp. H14-R3]